MSARPVVPDTAVLVAAVSESVGRPFHVHAELDIDVYRLRSADGGADLVVRVFDAGVEPVMVDAVVRVLNGLADTPFPAERCATSSPVLPIEDGVHLLLTEYVEPSPPPVPGFLLAWCAGLLGRLATRSGGDLPPGGGWHRLGPTPSLEIDQALQAGGSIGSAVAAVVDALAAADDGAGLPEALIHPDLTPPNMIPQGDRPPVVIDWIGVGRGPRVWPLAFLLLTAGPRAAPRVLDRYARSITLSDEEKHRLTGMMIARPLTLDLWSVANGRMTARQATTRLRTNQSRVDAIRHALT